MVNTLNNQATQESNPIAANISGSTEMTSNVTASVNVDVTEAVKHRYKKTLLNATIVKNLIITGVSKKLNDKLLKDNSNLFLFAITIWAFGIDIFKTNIVSFGGLLTFFSQGVQIKESLYKLTNSYPIITGFIALCISLPVLALNLNNKEPSLSISDTNNTEEPNALNNQTLLILFNNTMHYTNIFCSNILKHSPNNLFVCIGFTIILVVTTSRFFEGNLAKWRRFCVNNNETEEAINSVVKDNIDDILKSFKGASGDIATREDAEVKLAIIRKKSNYIGNTDKLIIETTVNTVMYNLNQLIPTVEIENETSIDGWLGELLSAGKITEYTEHINNTKSTRSNRCIIS